jgi:hypothetical protein
MNGSANRYELEMEGESVKVSTIGTGGVRVYTKVMPWQPDSSELSRYSGEYVADEVDSIMRLSVDEGTLMVTHRWIGVSPLEPIARNVFRAANGMMLEFERDQSDSVTGFYANSGRTLDVWFGKE